MNTRVIAENIGDDENCNVVQSEQEGEKTLIPREYLVVCRTRVQVVSVTDLPPFNENVNKNRLAAEWFRETGVFFGVWGDRHKIPASGDIVAVRFDVGRYHCRFLPFRSQELQLVMAPVSTSERAWVERKRIEANRWKGKQPVLIVCEPEE